MNTPQKYKIGTDYMRTVHSDIVKLPKKDIDPSITHPETKPLSKLYKNYLS
jgi:hypothetical protein